MSEHKTIEDKLKVTLSGDLQKNALDFMAFLRANDIIQVGQDAMHYMGECVCYLDTFDGQNSYMIWLAGDFSEEHEEFPLDNQTKELAWSHANECGNCDDCDCKPGKTATIFGREFTNICSGAHVDMKVYNPDIETLSGFKKLMEFRKFVIANRTAE